MDAHAQQRLTRVGPGTPMGELLRRYWFPVAASSELRAGTTLDVRLLSEDFVLFRSLSGKPGMLDAQCPHRGVALRHGLVDNDSISCPYHGWGFATDGRCLRMPAEHGVDDRMLARGRARAARIEELGGLVFAYLGPVPAPLLPRYDLLVFDDAMRDIGCALLPCNWLQIMENSVDPTHVEWLHGHHLSAVRARRGEPGTGYRRHHLQIDFEPFRYGIIKRRLLEGGSEQDEDWRVGHPLIFPCTLRVGAQNQHRFQFRVPVDDTHTRHWWYSCYRFPGVTLPAQPEIPVYEVPWQNPQGDFLLDTVDGGDIMAWVSQGPIADRTRERLVSSDRGIVLLRRMLAEQLEAVAQGLDPLGVIRDPTENVCIHFDQEHNKLGGGAAFLRAALELSHARYSPLKTQLLALLES